MLDSALTTTAQNQPVRGGQPPDEEEDFNFDFETGPTTTGTVTQGDAVPTTKAEDSLSPL